MLYKSGTAGHRLRLLSYGQSGTAEEYFVSCLEDTGDEVFCRMDKDRFILMKENDHGCNILY